MTEGTAWTCWVCGRNCNGPNETSITDDDIPHLHWRMRHAPEPIRVTVCKSCRIIISISDMASITGVWWPTSNPG